MAANHKGVERIHQIAALDTGSGSVTHAQAQEIVKELALINAIKARLDAVADKSDHVKEAAERREKLRLKDFHISGSEPVIETPSPPPPTPPQEG